MRLAFEAMLSPYALQGCEAIIGQCETGHVVVQGWQQGRERVRLVSSTSESTMT